MKLKDVIDVVGNKCTCLDFDTVWSVNDAGNICVNTDKTINIEDDVSVVYNWSHDGIDEAVVEKILEVIFNHDYETFLTYTEPDFPYNCYFPTCATIYLAKADCVIGHVLIGHNKEAFSLIEWADPHHV